MGRASGSATAARTAATWKRGHAVPRGRLSQGNVPSGDHRECLFRSNPPDPGGLVNLRLPDPLGTVC
jgi:hypothetical protein